MGHKPLHNRLSIAMIGTLLTSLILPGFAAQASQTQAATGNPATPIVSTVPVANQHGVRPDTKLVWQLNESEKHFKQWEDKLLKHDFTLELLNDGGEAIFTGSDSEFQYDDVQHTLTFIPPALLERYTTYGALLTFAQPTDEQLHHLNRKQLPQQPPEKIQAVEETTSTTDTIALSPNTSKRYIPSAVTKSTTTMSSLNKLEQATQQTLTNRQQTKTIFVGPQPVIGTNGALHPIDVAQGHEQKGMIESIDGSVITLFDGRQVTTTASTHIHLQEGPQTNQLLDLQPGDMVVITLDDHGTAKNVNVKNNDDTLATVFETGSALHEPTHITVEQKETEPRVTEDGHFTLVSTDDYGLPAWGSATSIELATTDGTTLHESAHVLPQTTFATSATDGRTDLTVVDHKPQRVVAKISMNGPYQDGRDAHGLVVFFNFHSGLPASATLTAPTNMEVASVTDISGDVQDIYGNPVEDCTTIDLQASAGTVGSPLATINGAFHTAYTAPTQVADVTLSLSAGNGDATTSRIIHLLPAVPAVMTLTAPDQLPAGTDATLHGTVTDQYGNNVLDGTSLVFSATAGTISEHVQTTGGAFDLPYTAPTHVQTVTVSGASVEGSASATTSLQIVPDAPARLTLQAENTHLRTGDQTPISGQVTDQYGNFIPAQQVDLSVLFGTVRSGTLSTDPAGWFTSTYIAPFYNGTDTVTATAGAAKATLDLNISSEGYGYNPGTGQIEPVAQLVFEQPSYSAAPKQLLNLTFHAYNAAGQPLEHVVIASADASIGTVHSICQQTDVAGACTLTYQAPSETGTATLTVHSGAVTGQATVNIFASGYGYDPTTKQWLPVGSIVFTTSTPTANPGQTIELGGEVWSTTGVLLSNVTFDKVTVSGGQATLPDSTDAYGKFVVTYTAPDTLGNQVVQLSSGNVTASTTVQVTHDNMGYDPINGVWVPVAQIVFNPNQYSTVTNGSVTLTGRVLASNGHALTLAKLRLSTDGGTTSAQVVTGTNGAFSLTYAAPAKAGTYHVYAATDKVSGVATVNVVAPSAPHFVNPTISLTGYGSGNSWVGTLSWGTKVFNADGSPTADQLFVLDDGDFDFFDYSYTDETGFVGGVPTTLVLDTTYTAYSGGRLVHYTSTTLRISRFDENQWVYLQPSFTKTFTFSW